MLKKIDQLMMILTSLINRTFIKNRRFNTNYKILIISCTAGIFSLFIIGLWWSKEPDIFDPIQITNKYISQKNNKNTPYGITYSTTLNEILRTILNKPGGYLANDITPPAIFLDNIHHWEQGALVILSNSTRLLRQRLSRSQDQSEYDKDLEKTEFVFNYSRNFMDELKFKSATELAEGSMFLRNYTDRLQVLKPDQQPAQFHANIDNFKHLIEQVIMFLNLHSKNLMSSSDNYSVPDNPPYESLEHIRPAKKVSWFLMDNNFYQARGACWALLHMLKAIEIDFNLIIEDRKANKTFKYLLHALESSLKIKNNFWVSSNDSLAMASYIDRAKTSALYLRHLLTTRALP